MDYIYFVCHGNICRSVAAEYIAKKISKERRLDQKYVFLSRATSCEELGNEIYPPMKKCLLKNNIPFKTHYAEQISQKDYENAKYIFYMDSHNKYNLEKRIKDVENKFHSICEFTDINEIEDPWFSGRYDLVVSELIQCINSLFENLLK